MEQLGRYNEMIAASRIQSRFARSSGTYDANAEAQKTISEHLAHLLVTHVGRTFGRTLEIGCGTGNLTRLLKEHCQVEEWVVNDLCEEYRTAASTILSGCRSTFIAGDASEVELTGSFDLIASSSVFQWIKEPEAFLRKLSCSLRTNGTLLFSTFSPENLNEIMELTGCGLSYPTKDALQSWISESMTPIYTEEQAIRITFPAPLNVLRHLRNTGVTATSSAPWTPGRLSDFRTRYTERFGTKDGGVTLTYKPLYIIARKQ